MSLENYFKNSWLKKEATSPQEIADQMGLVSRCMKDAGVRGISDDLRFYTAFNAILALANTALRASGYRTTTQPGHHTRTIETLEYTVQADDKTIRKIMAFSKKRNVASYDSAGSISDHPSSPMRSRKYSAKPLVSNQGNNRFHSFAESCHKSAHRSGTGVQKLSRTALRICCVLLRTCVTLWLSRLYIRLTRITRRIPNAVPTLTSIVLKRVRPRSSNCHCFVAVPAVTIN